MDAMMTLDKIKFDNIPDGFVVIIPSGLMIKNGDEVTHIIYWDSYTPAWACYCVKTKSKKIYYNRFDAVYSVFNVDEKELVKQLLQEFDDAS